MKKILALVVALLLVAGMVSAFADDAGSITLTNAEIGAKYQLYKLFDATVSPKGDIAYTLPTGKDVTNDTFFNTYFEIKNGNIIKKNTFTTEVLKSAEFKTWAAGFGTAVGSEVTASSSTVEWNPIAYGYYYITSSVGAVVSVDSANPHADVIDKNQTVKFDKYIVLTNGDKVKGNEAGLDIPVNFDLTATAKNYDGEDKIYEYTIEDEMEPGFTITSAPVLKIGGTQLTSGYTLKYYTAKGGTETTTMAEAQYFTITIPWTTDGTKSGTHKYANDIEINVTYTAKLDPAKAEHVNVGETPNLNKARITWKKDNSTTPNGELPWDTTKTWETWIEILKVDGKGKELTGAEFTLTSSTASSTKVSYVYATKYVLDAAGTYYKLNDGTYTAEAPNNDPVHDAVYASTTEKYKLVSEWECKGNGQSVPTISSYVDKDGIVRFSGLGTGTYKIEETVVPAGFNKAADLEFTISFALSGDEKDPTGTFSCDNAALERTNNLFSTTVVNNQGSELPHTGGMGTTILYIGGSILVLAAVILLVTKRRMKVED